MGQAGAASGSSIASLGLSAYSGIQKAEGEQASYEFQAAKAKRAAEFGRVQAGLTDTAFREELNTTLSNIDVMRAAGKIDPTSPTTAAFEERQRLVSDRQRLAAVGNIKQQVSEDEESARYLQKAGFQTMTNAYGRAGVSLVGAVASSLGGGRG